MTLFPIFTDLKGRSVLVVGGGVVATRKTQALLEAGAAVVVGAPALTPSLQGWVQSGRIVHLSGTFEATWLDAVWLVVAATDDRTVNETVSQAASARKMFCNVVDDPALSSFQVPSIVDRSPLVIAISSSGVAPVLARRLRERIESLFDQSLGALAALAHQFRPQIKASRPEMGGRRAFYDWLLDGPVAQALRQSRPDDAERALSEALATPASPPIGSVVLVGAGPGDPGLLTLKALRALNEADVILFDKLVSPAVLSLARRDAEQISVGKHPGEDHHATQARIHNLMVDHAKAGQRVVRLKGGDPFIFGRGGEELAHLAAHGIRFEVVPGITAALACAAYSGISLTHRDFAQSVVFATAHCAKQENELDWHALARPHQTAVFYMGVSQLDTLIAQLLRHGRAPDTPIAIIENGTRPEQRVLHATLTTVSSLAHEHHIKAPALLIVGEAVSTAATLHWFGQVLTGLPAISRPSAAFRISDRPHHPDPA